jgi:hypothetical protein
MVELELREIDFALLQPMYEISKDFYSPFAPDDAAPQIRTFYRTNNTNNPVFYTEATPADVHSRMSFVDPLKFLEYSFANQSRFTLYSDHDTFDFLVNKAQEELNKFLVCGRVLYVRTEEPRWRVQHVVWKDSSFFNLKIDHTGKKESDSAYFRLEDYDLALDYAKRRLQELNAERIDLYGESVKVITPEAPVATETPATTGLEFTIQLPDGSHLKAIGCPDGEFPAINTYWDRDELPWDSTTYPHGELLCFVEYNPEKETDQRVHIGAYCEEEEDTKYYEPYVTAPNGKKGAE